MPEFNYARCIRPSLLVLGASALLAAHTGVQAADPCKGEQPSAMLAAPEFEMRPRPTDEKDFEEYVKFLVEVANPRTEEQMKQDDCIKHRFRDTMIVDSLAVGAPGFPAGFSDEMYEGGTGHSVRHKYNVASWTVTNANAEDTPEVVHRRLKDTNKYWADRSDKYMQVRTVEDFYKVKESGKYGVFHNYQGMMPLSPSGDEKEALANLKTAYDLGVRQIMATYNVDSPYADGGVSNSDGTDQGVHEVGFAVIREMNRLGIAFDCSHSSNKTCIEGAVASTKPIMLSHSNVATLQPIDRNASDEAIKAVASTGGVICVNFIGGFLNSSGDSSAFSIAKHAEYIRNLTGPEHVCAGSDYVWNYADTLHWILRNPKDFPVESGYATPSHMGKPSEMWATARVLEETYGWTEDEIAGFLGENLVRFYSQVWN